MAGTLDQNACQNGGKCGLFLMRRNLCAVAPDLIERWTNPANSGSNGRS